MVANLGRFSNLDGGGGRVGSSVENGVLGWRDDADVECHLTPVVVVVVVVAPDIKDMWKAPASLKAVVQAGEEGEGDSG